MGTGRKGPGALSPVEDQGSVNVLTDVAVAIYLVVFIATPPLAIAASVLLIAAFGAGLGNPESVEPDAERVELHPLPNPG